MKFVKELLRPAIYNAKGLDGGRVRRTITESDLKNAANTFDQMKESGFQIPAPLLHGKPGKDMLGPVVQSDAQAVPANLNAGWWNRVWYDQEKQALYGEVDVPIEATANLIGKTIREVSPVLRDFTDGSGKVWKNALYHIALVQHPVMAKQENFVPSDSLATTSAGEGFAFSLGDIEEILLTDPVPSGNTEGTTGVQFSDGRTVGPSAKKTTGTEENEEGSHAEPDGDDKAGGQKGLKDVLGLLKALNISLPEDTTPENFIERMKVALKALAHVEGADKKEQQPTEQPLPIALSLGDTNVADSNPFQILAENSQRANYIQRIEALVASGRITPAYAMKHLKPLVEGFAMSLDGDGKPSRGMIDELIEACEDIPENSILNVSGKGKTDKSKKGVAFSFEEEIPPEYLSGGMTEEQQTQMVSDQLKALNH